MDLKEKINSLQLVKQNIAATRVRKNFRGLWSCFQNVHVSVETFVKTNYPEDAEEIESILLELNSRVLALQEDYAENLEAKLAAIETLLNSEN